MTISLGGNPPGFTPPGPVQDRREFGFRVLLSCGRLKRFLDASPAVPKVLEGERANDTSIPRSIGNCGPESGTLVIGGGRTTCCFEIVKTMNRPNPDGEVVNRSRLVPDTSPVVSWMPLPVMLPLGHCVAARDQLMRSFRGVRRNEGICNGMCHWFFYLYFRTKNRFTDPRSHMKALGEQFVNGGGRDPVLLHRIGIGKYEELLGLKIGVHPEFAGETPRCLSRLSGSILSNDRNVIQVTADAWRASDDHWSDVLQNLQPGAYRILLPRHATAYVKIDDAVGYFFDPDDGIIEINGTEQGRKVYELMNISLTFATPTAACEIENEIEVALVAPSETRVDFPPVEVGFSSAVSYDEVESPEGYALKKIWESVFNQLEPMESQRSTHPAEEIGTWMDQHADQLGQIKELSLRGKGLTCLPEKIMKLFIGLKRLDLSDNQITELPHGIFAGLPLEELHIYGNPLREYSPEMWGLTTRLSRLDLVQNALQAAENLVNRQIRPTSPGVWTSIRKIASKCLGNLGAFRDPWRLDGWAVHNLIDPERS